MNDVFTFAGLSVRMEPAITKWGFDDLGDAPNLHRWRAWWAGGDAISEVSGIELRAYPVARLTPSGAWIDVDGYRQATKQPWEDGAPDKQWVPASWHKLRWVSNGSGQAWVKPTQDEAIKSLAIRLCRWSNRVAGDVNRVRSAAKALETLRPDFAAYADTARKNIGATQ